MKKFLYLFISGKTGQEKEFCNFLDRKLAFLDYKSNDLKKSKNLHFSMVLAKIIKCFYFFFLGKIRQQKLIGNVLYRKLAFLDYKNNDLKKSKNLHFSKGVSPWFWPKL